MQQQKPTVSLYYNLQSSNTVGLQLMIGFVIQHSAHQFFVYILVYSKMSNTD